jgi:hypothetical protein
MLILMGEFSARTEENIGRYGENTRNINGMKLIEFVPYNKLEIMNIMLKNTGTATNIAEVKDLLLVT